MRDDIYLLERDARLRRQADEQYARQWDLANLARPRSAARLQVRQKLGGLASSAAQRVGQWLAGPSDPQEQCC